MTNCTSLLVISVCFSFLSITAAFQKTSFHHPKYKFASHHKNAIPGRYLIEFKSNTEHNNAFFDGLKDQFQAVDLNQDTLVSSDATFRSLHVNDASMDDTQHSNLLQSLVDQDDVVAVYPVTLIDRPNAVSNGYYSRIEKNVTETIQAHQLTQVDRLHKELGLTGKGIKVCVIDSGIDFNHPALGGGFGPGYKVSFGADLVGDNFDPESSSNTVVPDGTPPLDNCGQVDIKSCKFLL
jgi:subtilisin family serine protease